MTQFRPGSSVKLNGVSLRTSAMANFKPRPIVPYAFAEILVRVKIYGLDAGYLCRTEGGFHQPQFFDRSQHLSDVVGVVDADIFVLVRTVERRLALLTVSVFHHKERLFGIFWEFYEIVGQLRPDKPAFVSTLLSSEMATKWNF